MGSHARRDRVGWAALVCASGTAAIVSCSEFRRGPFGSTGDGGTTACGVDFVTCNPLTSAGCSAGQTCVPLARMGMPTGACVASGNIAVGSPCASSDRCAPGAGCVEGLCRTRCCEGDDATCRAAGNANGRCGTSLVAGTTLSACLDQCDWRTQDCPNGATCTALNARGDSDCVPAGSAGDGDPCTLQSDCARGLLCVGPTGAGGLCRRLCDPTVPTSCGTLNRCVPLDGSPPTFGACLR